MNQEIKQELEEIAVNGVINPHAVVEKARDPDSALHDQFTWDDGEAADKWRLEEARKLIRVFVIAPVGENPDPIRAFVSLTTDRRNGGGYRALADVLNDDELRQQMLQDALDELNAFSAKYARVKELAPVFKAVEKAEHRHRQRQSAEPLRAAA